MGTKRRVFPVYPWHFYRYCGFSSVKAEEYLCWGRGTTHPSRKSAIRTADTGGGARDDNSLCSLLLEIEWLQTIIRIIFNPSRTLRRVCVLCSYSLHLGLCEQVRTQVRFPCEGFRGCGVQQSCDAVSSQRMWAFKLKLSLCETQTWGGSEINSRDYCRRLSNAVRFLLSWSKTSRFSARRSPPTPLLCPSTSYMKSLTCSVSQIWSGNLPQVA